jgi:hypothetical protein
VLPLAKPHERPGLLATIYLISSQAFGVPAIFAGISAAPAGLLTTARWYSVVVLAFAAAALTGLVAQRGHR